MESFVCIWLSFLSVSVGKEFNLCKSIDNVQLAVKENYSTIALWQYSVSLNSGALTFIEAIMGGWIFNSLVFSLKYQSNGTYLLF